MNNTASEILIPYDEETACDNEIRLQEFINTCDIDTKKYLDYGCYEDFAIGRVSIPISDPNAFRINMGIIICRFAAAKDIIKEFKNGDGIWADKYWGFSGFSPASLRALCGFYAAWQYSDVLLQGAEKYACVPECIDVGGRKFLKVNDKCRELYANIYCENI